MKNLVLIAFALAVFTSTAQQISLNSQYMFNEIVINPGATGTKDYIPVHLNFRKQWAGFKGAPTTQTASAHASVGNNLGFGGFLFNDVAGPSRRSGVQLNGAYNLRLSRDKKHNLGLGLGMSFTQHILDINSLETELPDDPAVARSFNHQFVPDATFGAYYTFEDKGFFGLSARNLLQSRRDLFNFDQTFSNTLVRTYYAFGGYTFTLNDKWGLKTTGLLDVIEAGVFQFDVSVLAVYNKMFWFGGSYRNMDAGVAMAGLQLGAFKFGYSYDITFSDIRSYQTGSHEIFLELQLTPSQGNGGGSRTPWLKRNRIYAPSI